MSAHSPAVSSDTRALDETRAAVREMLATVFAHEATLDRARAVEPLGFDPVLWSHVRSVGAPALGLSDGGGVDRRALVTMAEEVGRCIASVPLIEHTVAARLLERSVGTVDDGVVDGSTIATIALRPAVDGVWTIVPAGAVASVVIGVDGDDLVVAHGQPPMTAPRNHASAPLADRAIGQMDVVHRINTGRDLDRAIVEWRLLTAAALVSMSQTALELAVAYATDRRQFGVPIGSFQSVQHSLADLPGLIDGAQLLVHEGAWALDTRAGADSADVGGARIDLADDRIDDADALTLMAFLFASEVAATVTHRSLHVHGGYGFSEEYDIQLLHRRARGWPLVAGDLGRSYQHLADRLLGGVSA